MEAGTRTEGRLRALLRALARRLAKIRGRPERPTVLWDPVTTASDPLRRSEWWSRLSGRDPREVAALLDYSARIGGVESDPAVLAVGYALNGAPRPLLLLDASRLGIPPEPYPIAVSSLPYGLGDRIELPIDAPALVALPTARPEALAGPASGQLVGARRRRDAATVGVRTLRQLGDGSWRAGFLTAGHAFPEGVGSEVVRLPSGRVRRQWRELAGRGGMRRTGVVAAHRSPTFAANREPDDELPAAEFDFALVDLDDGWTADLADGPFGFEVPAAAVDFAVPQRVVALGGVSGRVDRISVMGALMETAHRWRDCWLLGPSTALRRGDSGASIHDYGSGAPIGTLVGRSALLDETHFLYAQSLERLMAECLRDLRVCVQSIQTKGSK